MGALEEMAQALGGLRPAMEFKTIASKIVYANHWMRVREDEIERANGSPGVYGVVEKLDYSLIVPRDDRGVFLIDGNSQYRPLTGWRYCKISSGEVEPGEKLPSERELCNSLPGGR